MNAGGLFRGVAGDKEPGISKEELMGRIGHAKRDCDNLAGSNRCDSASL